MAPHRSALDEAQRLLAQHLRAIATVAEAGPLEHADLDEVLACAKSLREIESARIMVRLKAMPPDRLATMTAAEVLALFEGVERGEHEDPDPLALPAMAEKDGE